MLEDPRGMGQQAAEPPEAPSGFNNTQHNCNTPTQPKSKRPKSRHCGTYTLIGTGSDGYVHQRFRCKGYACGLCGPKKIRKVRKRIVQHAIENKLQRFLSLTLDSKKMPSGLELKEKIAYLYAVWRKMRVYLKRLLGKSLAFIAALELQSNGNPHLHLLVGSYLPKQWITAAWQALGGGWSTRIGYADVHRVAAYIAKYVTHESICDLPAVLAGSLRRKGWPCSSAPTAKAAGYC